MVLMNPPERAAGLEDRSPGELGHRVNHTASSSGMDDSGQTGIGICLPMLASAAQQIESCIRERYSPARLIAALPPSPFSTPTAAPASDLPIGHGAPRVLLVPPGEPGAHKLSVQVAAVRQNDFGYRTPVAVDIPHLDRDGLPDALAALYNVAVNNSVTKCFVSVGWLESWCRPPLRNENQWNG